MKLITDKLLELITTCETRVAKVEKEVEANKSLKATLDAQQKSINDQRKALDADRKAMKEKKIVVSTIKEANRTKSEAVDLKATVKKEVAELEAQKKLYKKEHDTNMADVKRRQEKIDVAWKKLDREKKSYKAEVMAQIEKEQQIKNAVNR